MLSFSSLIDDASKISEARRMARRLAQDIGFEEAPAERVSIVVTEAATNLLKHAGGGELLVRTAGDEMEPCVEVLALDRGPGFEDVERCLHDGYSSQGTLGGGLGAIARLSSHCDIYSRPGAGAALLARMAHNGSRRIAGRSQVGAVNVAKRGEDVCGDAWWVRSMGARRMLLVADGLGHGPDAAKAASAAVDCFKDSGDGSPKELLEWIHQALRPTRGAAVAVAELDADRRVVNFAGLGNISGIICPPNAPARHMVSISGTAGVDARSVREFTYPWPEDSLVVLHSDGIGTHWNLRDFPGLAARDPGLVAGVLYRDFSRQRDDATVIVSSSTACP